MGPHDAFFKAVYKVPSQAADHFRAFLPPELVEALDFEAMTVLPDTYVDEALKSRHTDILYEVPWRHGESHEHERDEPVLLYVLFEHQSRVDKLMAFRMLRYAMRIWDTWERQHPDATRLPALLPLVLYHGQAGWTAATELSELFTVPQGVASTLAPWLPRFSYLLQTVAELPKERLAGTGMARLALALFQHGKREELPEILRELLSELAVVVRQHRGLIRLEALITYVYRVSETVSAEELAQILAPIDEEAGALAMSVYQRAHDKGLERGRQEGRQEGRLEGRQEGRLEGRQEGRLEGRQEGERAALEAVARRLLDQGKPIEVVCEITGMSVEDVRALAH